ncbi:hypothetical protein GCM10023231_40930 [Olivibacter ginsenosidimutans]|uniref:Efflux RND transporter periplasmic adaptor subunit n=2 Tax=Olivibacter ginsenosidimutans TaxID=1176537 RepID=A0ABP9CBW5_9SPHI
MQQQDVSAVSDSIIRHLQTAKVSLDKEDGYVKLNGKIVPDESKEAKIFALASGKISSLNVALGDYVQKGQVLAVLQSSEVANTSNELAIAKADLAVKEKSVKAQKELFDGGLATEREYVEAEMEYKKALAAVSRTEQVAAITGGDKATYWLKAPISGFLLEKNVTNNSEIRQDNAINLFTIADLTEVWVIANVYEADINHIQLGDSVVMNTLANPKKNYVGKIDRIYHVLDPATRTMQVRVSLGNPNNELKPEMFVTMKVAQAPMGKALTIPSRALIMENSRYYVIVRQQNQLKIQAIELLNRSADKAYVQGLSLHDEVVVNEQVFLYEALSSK